MTVYTPGLEWAHPERVLADLQANAAATRRAAAPVVVEEIEVACRACGNHVPGKSPEGLVDCSEVTGSACSADDGTAEHTSDVPRGVTVEAIPRGFIARGVK